MGIDFTGVRAAMKATLAAVFPPQCPNCGSSVADEGGLCASCWREAEFISGCACTLCGVPQPDNGGLMEYDEVILCDDCLRVPRPWHRGAAALVYAGTGRKMAMAFKHGDRVDLAPVLGRWVAQAATLLIEPGMVVVPVPVHPRRMMARKYNQAALLAAQVARAHGLAHLPGALVRTRHTPMQDHGTVSDRFANVEGALTVPMRMQTTIRGRPVLLIDDVMASGATLAAAAAALIAGGSGAVSVAVLARAIKVDRPPANADPMATNDSGPPQPG